MATKRSHFELTPEQIELSEKRKQKKQKQKQLNLAGQTHLASESQSTPPNHLIRSREWTTLPHVPVVDNAVVPFKIMTFNLLAQSLIRRELFPTSSHVLKAGTREPMLHAEILSHGADILCLQEVDRLDKLMPMLDKAGYSYTYASGPGKKHGCLIAYAAEKYTKIDEKVIQYDEQGIRDSDNERARVGCSFRTRNIGSLVALEHLNGGGIVVATTHLFWHPSYHYERTRQAGILVRETVRFRRELGLEDLPAIIAGDFNFSPSDPAYSLLVGDTLSQDQEHLLDTSRVVHVSIDATVSSTNDAQAENEGGEADPDKVIKQARIAAPADGLLSTPEIVELFAAGARLWSSYDKGQKMHKAGGAKVPTFGDRCAVPPGKSGAHEPMWTCYTHYWKTVLDYIFVLDPKGSSLVMSGYTNPHRTEDIKLGLPQAGICGSDHFSTSISQFQA